MPTRAQAGSAVRGWWLSPRMLVLVAAVAVVFIVHLGAWPFLCDDAFISFRYANNLADHGALVFNVDPIEYVEGYTNFLWVVVLAAGAAVGVAPHELAPLLTKLGSATALVLVTLLAHSLLQRTPGSRAIAAIELGPAALLCASPEYVVWANGGLETSLALALGLGAMLSWQRGHPYAAAVLAAAAGLTRTDTLLYLGLFMLGWLAVVSGRQLLDQPAATVRRAFRRPMLLAGVLFAAPLLAHLLWRHAYYGAWLPNTWTIKAHGRLLQGSNGVAYVRVWADAVGLVYLIPLAAFIRLRHLVLIGPIVGVVTYAWWVGGDFMAYGRFLLPATSLLAILVVWLVADATDFLGRRLPAAVARAAPLAIVAGLCLALGLSARARWHADRSKPEGWLDGRWEGVTTMDRFARVRVAAGTWMRHNLPPDTFISVGAAGALPYASRLPTMDAYGLIDPAIATLASVQPRTDEGARPGHQLYAPARYIKKRDPDLLCHVGYHGPRRPGERAARRPFKTGYVWACVEAEPVADPREPSGMLDVGYYCCRRPRDRIVGRFGREDAP